MQSSELDETGQQFMIRLFEQTGGDQAVQVSMYEIGDLLDLDRRAASRVAEELIGLQLVELKTLAGGIGISASGSEMVQGSIGPPASAVGASASLGNEAQLNTASRQAVEQLVIEVKDQTGTLGLNFDTLTELMADIKSIDAQLGSSRPKTAIIRECLLSISGVMKGTANRAFLGRISQLLGD